MWAARGRSHALPLLRKLPESSAPHNFFDLFAADKKIREKKTKAKKKYKKIQNECCGPSYKRLMPFRIIIRDQ